MSTGLAAALGLLAGVCLGTGGLWLFGWLRSRKNRNITEDDIKQLVSEGHSSGALKAGEAEMARRVFELDEKQAGDIMTHRSAVVGLDGDMTLEEAVAFILKDARNSRFPVYLEDMDHIIGILHIRDVLLYSENPLCRAQKLSALKGLLREPHFIPEIRRVDQLFHEMQATKIQMVIVSDEYGQTAGIITMEDILEEIVGSIEDEYDKEEKRITRRRDGSYQIDGFCPLTDVAETLGIPLTEDEEENFETISGYLIARLAHIPEEKEKPVIAWGGWVFRVRIVRNHTIRLIIAVKPEAREEEDGSSGAEKDIRQGKDV